MRRALPALLIAVAGAAGIVALTGDDRANGGPGASAAASERWLALSASPLARTEVGAARIGGFIYVVGGFLAPTGETTNQVARYEIASDQWDLVEPMPVGVNHPAVAVVRDRLYVHGGYTADGSLGGETDALQRYDPAAGEWETLTPSGPPRAAGTLAVRRGRLFSIGGVRDGGRPLRLVEVYDIARDRWRTARPLRVAREHLASAVLGGRIFAIAGRARGRNLRVVERLDPGASRWRRARPVTVPRSGFQAVAVAGRIVVVGGEQLAEGDETIRRVEMFAPRRKRWLKLPGMLTPRHGLGVVVRGRRVFALEGGPQPGFAFSSLLEYLDVPARGRPGAGLSSP